MNQVELACEPRQSPSVASSVAKPTTMKAMAYHEYGPPDCLAGERFQIPQAGKDEVLMRVRACGVNPIEARLREGEFRGWLPGGFPRIPGYDVAGEIVAGHQAAGFQPGDRVMAFLDSIYGGGYAEYAVCSVHGVVRIPDCMSFEEAAALPLAASTALQSLRDHAHIAPGESVLINGASGGVGCFAVQIANAYGAQVTGVASGESEAFVRALGARSFIAYETTDFAQSRGRWDIVFDVAGTSSFLDARKSLKRGGRFISTEPDLRNLLSAALTVPIAKKGRPMLARSRASDLAELVRLYEAGDFKVTVERIYPLHEAAAAHRQLEQGGNCGKLVLRVSD